MSKYMISIPRNDTPKVGTIHDPGTKLKVKVFDLLKSGIKPVKGEKIFFVTSAHEKLAFETRGYSKHKNLLILQMIAHYCIYLGLFDPKIHATWPF